MLWSRLEGMRTCTRTRTRGNQLTTERAPGQPGCESQARESMGKRTHTCTSGQASARERENTICRRKDHPEGARLCACALTCPRLRAFALLRFCAFTLLRFYACALVRLCACALPWLRRGRDATLRSIELKPYVGDSRGEHRRASRAARREDLSACALEHLCTVRL
jgi:hypothetical protein